MGITLENVSYTYQAGTPFESPALFEVNLEIKMDHILLWLVIQVVENQLFYNY